MKKTISWLSAGISSFIATYIAKDEIDEIYYIHIDDQEDDTLRFVKDCEKVIGKPIKILQSEYKSVENAVLAFGHFRNAHSMFYPCTNWLKKRVRKEQVENLHQDDEITYIWGFDCNERHRVARLVEGMPNFKHRFPLNENNLTKQDCHAMAKRLGVKRPYMYDLGYNNNNCIGCLKGGMGYWNKIRKDFPEVFKSRAKLERKICEHILKECYLDELEPNRGLDQVEITEDCGIFCELSLRSLGE